MEDRPATGGAGGGAGKDLYKDTDFRDSRDELEVAMFAFLDAAREELRIPPSTPLDGTPDASTG